MCERLHREEDEESYGNMKGKHSCYACGEPCDCSSGTALECEKCEACVETDWNYEDNFDQDDWGV